RCRIQMRHLSDIVEIHKPWQVAIFDAIFGTDVLVLVIVIFAEFRESHCGEALLIERIMIAAAQKTIESKDRHWLHATGVGPANLDDIAGQLARWRIAFAADGANPADLRITCGIREAL